MIFKNVSTTNISPHVKSFHHLSNEEIEEIALIVYSDRRDSYKYLPYPLAPLN